MRRVSAVLIGFVLLASSCVEQPTAPNPYPLIPEDPAVSLEALVQGYTDRVGGFDTGLGIFDSGSSASTADETVVQFDDLNHSLGQTAYLAAAMGYKYAETGDPQALAIAKRTWDGMHAAANISRHSDNVLANSTDRPILARWVGPVTPASDAFLDRFGGCYYGPVQCPEETGTPWGDVQWISSISKDMYTYWYFGAAALYDTMDDPAMKAEIATDIQELTDGLIQANFNLVDPTTGQATNAPLILGPQKLAFLAIAHHITGDETYRNLYLNDTFTWGNLPLLSQVAQNIYVEHFGTSLTVLPYFHLLQYEPVEARRSVLLTTYSNNVVAHTKNKHHSLFDVFDAANGARQLTPELSADVAGTLEGFGPAPRRMIQPTLPTDIPLDSVSVTLHDSDPSVPILSAHALPSQMWCRSPLQWSRSTRLSSCAPGAVDYIYNTPELMTLGADVQVAYWMARYFEVIDDTV